MFKNTVFSILSCVFLVAGLVPTAAAQTSSIEDKHIVFMIAEREYQTIKTLHDFAERHVRNNGGSYTFATAAPDDPNHFPDIQILPEADLLVLSVRRRTLRSEDFAVVKKYIDSGKPLLALRTSSHAFHHRNTNPDEGHEEWRTFDTDILGGRYEGHFDNDSHPTISRVAPINHPLLHRVENLPYVSRGSLYRSRDLASATEVVLEGTIFEEGARYTEPVAWTHSLDGQHIFYTSLGHESDFEQPAFKQLLLNAMNWCLIEKP